VALDVGFIDEPAFAAVQEKARRVGDLLGGLRRYLQRTTVSGSKFRRE